MNIFSSRARRRVCVSRSVFSAGLPLDQRCPTPFGDLRSSNIHQLFLFGHSSRRRRKRCRLGRYVRRVRTERYGVDHDAQRCGAVVSHRLVEWHDDSFGLEIAFDGGNALINEAQSAGIVRFYRYTQGGFQPETPISLTFPEAANSCWGCRLAISADGLFAAVSAFDYDDATLPGDDHGIVFLYRLAANGTRWVYQTAVTAGTHSTTNGKFGHSVAMSGDGSRLVVGQGGSVHIFERRQTSLSTFDYQQVKVLVGVASQSGFGWDVDISEDGETLVVSHPLSPVGVHDSGGIVIYRRHGGAWDVVNAYGPPNPQYTTGFGWVVAVSEDVVASATANYTPPSPGSTFSAMFAWTNDVDERHFGPSSQTPAITKFGAGNSTLDISMDGRWIFVGMSSFTDRRIYVLSISTPPPAPRRAADFDGDGASDLNVFRRFQGIWYGLPSSTGVGTATFWGSYPDLPVPADYDGDGKADHAVYRPSTGAWFVLKTTGGGVSTFWGVPGDVPVPADYDGDGKTDLAVFRPANGLWSIIPSKTGIPYGVYWALSGDVPIPADYDGDGKADPTVFRPSTSTWYQLRSTTGAGFGVTWGLRGDIPLAGDYDGDGRADPTVFRPSSGTWYQLRSTSGAFFGGYWGVSGDIPIVGDYDGDGKADLTIYRPWTSTWYQLRSLTGAGFAVVWGWYGDFPM